MGEADAQDQPKAPPLKRRLHRSAFQYAVLVFNSFVILCCFIGAAVLVAGQQVLNNIHRTEALVVPSITDTPKPIDSTDTTDPGDTNDPASSDTEPPPTTFPPADPEARNFLVTGSDNGACADPDSANPVEERDELGERSDTIMIMRVDPSTSRAAVLSFPRDLRVKIYGTNGKNRINAAYEPNDPNKLIGTIAENFGVPVHHYIQIDFCAFKTLVDAVDGVTVPFEFAARDRNTNLDIPEPGCHNLNGDQALAYVRSRHYQYRDASGTYKTDGTSDYGRIARQQDFLRRAVDKVLSQGFSLEVARGLIEVAHNYVVLDPQLSLDRMLQFAGVLKNLDPTTIQTYRVEGRGVVVGGASVIEPNLDSANMQSILAIFRGEAQLEGAPEQIFESTTSAVPRTTTTTSTTTTTTKPSTSTTSRATGTTRPATSTTSTTTTTTTTTTTSLPEVAVSQTTIGIVPPKDMFCE